MRNFIIGSGGKINHDVMGLFAFVNNMTSSIWVNKNNENDINFFYDIVGNSPYYDTTISYTNNVWEYYFDPPSGIKYVDMDRNIETIEGIWSTFNGGLNIVSRFHTKGTITEEERVELKHISDTISNGRNKIKLKEDIQYIVNKYKKDLFLENTKYISVHYRSFMFEQNKKYNPHQSRKIELEYWFNEIDRLVTGEHKIFLATDDDRILKMFIERYGDKLVYNKDVERIYTDDNDDVGNNPYSLPNELLWIYKSLAQSTKRKQSPYESGLYAIIDCWLLSGGEHIIKPHSGLSFFSTVINPNIGITNIDNLY